MHRESQQVDANIRGILAARGGRGGNLRVTVRTTTHHHNMHVVVLDAIQLEEQPDVKSRPIGVEQPTAGTEPARSRSYSGTE